MNPDPHTWTQSRAAGKIYELEQRLNQVQTTPQAAEPAKAAKSKPKRTVNQRRNDKVMKRSHVHRAQLKAECRSLERSSKKSEERVGDEVKWIPEIPSAAWCQDFH